VRRAGRRGGLDLVVCKSGAAGTAGAADGPARWPARKLSLA